MTAGVEADDLMDFIIAALEADAPLSAFGLHGWYKDGAQTAAGYPFGIVGVMSSLGVNYPGPRREAANVLIQVKIIGPQGIFDSIIKPAYKRVYAILFGLDGSNSDVTVIGKLYQEVDINYSEPGTIQGDLIKHLGGGWRSLAA